MRDRLWAGLLLRQRVVRGRLDLFVDLCADALDLCLRRVSLVREPARKRRDGVARGVRIALFRRPIQNLVVRQRVRVRPYDFRVHERRSFALSRVVHRLAHHRQRREKVAAVHFLDEQIRKSAHELRDRSARGIHLDGHRDRVAVVFHEIHDGEFQVGRGVQRFPKLPFTRLAFARRHEDDFVFLETLAKSQLPGLQHRLRGPRGLEKLRPRR